MRLNPLALWCIGANTFREAVRLRFFAFLLVLGIGLVGSAVFFRKFDFESQELKFIGDFGFGAILLFGTILAVVMTAHLLFNEIDNRTALTMLAKPVRRWEFLVGKWLGVVLLLAVFCLVMFIILAGMLYYREEALRGRVQEAIDAGRVLAGQSPFAEGRLVDYPGLALFAVLQWLRLCLLAAMTLFIGAFASTSLYTMVIGFFAALVAQLEYIAIGGWAESGNALVANLVALVGLLIPNFQLFNVGEVLVFPRDVAEPLGVASYAIAAIAVAYTLAFLGLAVFAFRKREI